MILDQTTDIAKTEEMSVCLRFVDVNEGALREDFVEFVQASDVRGLGPCELILGRLKNFDMN